MPLRSVFQQTVTLDVQDALETALYKRLLNRLRDQGWPKTL